MDTTDFISFATNDIPAAIAVAWEEGASAISKAVVRKPFSGDITSLIWRSAEILSPNIFTPDWLSSPGMPDMVKRVLSDNTLFCLGEEYLDRFLECPFREERMPEVIAWQNFGSSAVTEVIPSLRYSDYKEVTPIPRYLRERGFLTPNPAWDSALFEDHLYVLEGWLTEWHLEGFPYGRWEWINVREAETNPNGDVGHFRGVLNSYTKLDKSKVLRIRVRR